MKTSLLIMVSILAFSMVAANAEPYAQVNMGVAFPPTYAIGGSVGLNLNDNVRAEIEYEYMRPDTSDVTGSAIDFGGIWNDASTSVHTVLANAYYDFKNSYKLTPYIGGGIGFAVFSSDAGTPRAGYLTLSSNDTTTAFAYQATAGAAYKINDTLSLGALLRYIGTSDGTFKPTVYSGLTPIGSTSSSVRLSNAILQVGLRYTFK